MIATIATCVHDADGAAASAIGAVGDGEDDIAHAHPQQQVELVPQERPVHHGHHGFGRSESERPEPGPLPTHQDDGFHRSAIKRTGIIAPRRRRAPKVGYLSENAEFPTNHG